MTCIASWREAGSVWMGGDSAGVSDYSLTVRADKKVFIKEEPLTATKYLFGFTSSFRMGQLLQYKLNIPARPKDAELFAYMATSFVDAIRQCLKDGGYATVDNVNERGGTFLVALAGRVFKIGGDYQVGESENCYDSCGCGEDVALGALYALKECGEDVSPEQKLRLALASAERHSAGVRSPFAIFSI